MMALATQIHPIHSVVVYDWQKVRTGQRALFRRSACILRVCRISKGVWSEGTTFAGSRFLGFQADRPLIAFTPGRDGWQATAILNSHGISIVSAIEQRALLRSHTIG